MSSPVGYREKNRVRGERGVALTALIFIILILGVLGYAFVGIISREQLAITKPLESAQAFYLAEAAAQIGRKFARQMLQEEVDPTGGGIDGYYYRYEGQPLAGGTFDLAFKKPWDTENFLFAISGYCGGSQRSLEVRFIPDHSKVPGCPPGVLADEWVHFQNNAYIDSYDSRAGAWQGEGVEKNGHAWSNCNCPEVGITVENNATIYGNAYVTTPEDDGDVEVANNGIICGKKCYGSDRWELKPIAIPAGLEYTQEGDPKIEGETGKNGDYEITDNIFILKNNGEATFYAGQYRFAGFECSNNARLTVNGLCEIYLENSFVLENNSELLPPIELQGDTTKLRIYFQGTQKVDLSNNVVFYGFIYAPEALIEIRNNDAVFGALVGKQIYIWNNAGVHYDKALWDEDFGNVLGPPAPPLSRVSWEEVF